MNSKTTPANEIVLRFVWPVELLDTVICRRTAIVLLAERLSDFERIMVTSGRALSLARNHVELFALVGDDSDRSHDSLDQALEASRNDSIVTTFHGQDELEDAAALVIANAQATGIEQILVVVDPSSVVGKRLGEFLDEFLPKRNS